ncbi:MAG: TetR/AcrR family transcriptional regulator [Bifidobacterium sp.]
MEHSNEGAAMNDSGRHSAASVTNRDSTMHLRRNTTRDTIYATAFKLFAAQGYGKTTMSSIAQACNTTKTLVQYHAPRKEMFIDVLVTSLFELIESAFAHTELSRSIDSLERLYITGFLHFNLLTRNQRMERVTKDIVASRRLTESMIDAEISLVTQTSTHARHQVRSGAINEAFTMWSSFVDDHDVLQPRIEQAVVAGQGGAYELMHHEYLHHRSPDPGSLTDLSYGIFTGLSGESHSESMHALPTLHELRSSKALRAIIDETQRSLTSLLSD